MGKIAFSSKRSDFNFEIYLMNADGTGVQRLTYDPADDFDPAISPDGSRIAFASHRGFINNGYLSPAGLAEIYVVNADGSGLVQLTSRQVITRHPVWSPDGTKIAFVSERAAGDAGSDIYITNADGSQPRLLVGADQNVIRWFATPQGDKIEYYRPNDGSPNLSYARSINPDGTNEQLLQDGFRIYSSDGAKYATRSSLYALSVYNSSDDTLISTTSVPYLPGVPCFSADNQKIFFSAEIVYRDDADNIDVTAPQHLFSINVSGGGLSEMTRNSGDDADPSAGPGPTVSVPEGPKGSGRFVFAFGQSIYTMYSTGWGVISLKPAKPGGGSLTNLENPVWNATGDRIAMDDGKAVYTMAADGSDLRQVTGTPADNSAISATAPAFSPDGQYLAYTYYNGQPYYYQDKVHIAKLDGTFDMEAINDLSDNPAWSPVAGSGQSSQLAYFFVGPYLETSVRLLTVQDGVASPAGTVITNGGNDNGTVSYSAGVWNANGTRIFTIRHTQTGSNAFDTDLLSVDPSNSVVTVLTHNAANLAAGDFVSASPDGASLALSHVSTGIFVLDLPGSALRLVSPTDLGNLSHASWGSNTATPPADPEPPTVTVATHPNQETITQLSISGTAVDSGGSNAASVTFKLQRLADQKYWSPAISDPSQRWGATPAPLGTALPGSVGLPGDTYVWTAAPGTLPPRAQFLSGSYRVTARAIDNAGNVGPEVSQNFTIYTPGHLEFSRPDFTVREAGGAMEPEAIAIRRIGGTDGTISADITNSFYCPLNAAADQNYGALPTSITFGPGETEKTLTIPIVNDSVHEGTEFLSFNLTSDTGEPPDGGAAQTSMTLTLLDDEEEALSGQFAFGQTAYDLPDDGSTVTITITRSGGKAGSLYASTELDYANIGKIYTVLDATTSFSFPDGDSTTQSFHVKAAPGATVGQSVLLGLSVSQTEVAFATLTVTHAGAGGSAGLFQFSSASASGTEGDAAITLTVNRSGGSSGAVNVPYARSGTAISGSDYTVDVASPLHFAAGETSKQLHVTLLTDVISEADETAIFTLGAPSNGGTAGAISVETVTIQNGAAPSNTLTVAVSGPANSGTVPAGFLGASARVIGKKYTVAATAKPGYLFAGWTGPGLNSGNPKLTFTMVANLALTAHFVANPFLATAGEYLGLSAATAPEVDPALVDLTLTSVGGFSGNISYPLAVREVLAAGLNKKLPIKGVFDVTGHYVRSGAIGPVSFSLDLQHNPANGGSISGSFILGSTTFQVTAKRAAYSKKNPTSVAGAYTLALSPEAGNDAAPKGHGFARVAIGTSGKVHLIGLLSDGNPVSAAGPLTGVADFAVFLPLYKKAAGQLTGNMVIAPDQVLADSDIQATLVWIRPASPNDGKIHSYPNGFFTQLTALASVYHVPAAGLNVFGATLSAEQFATLSPAPSSVEVVHAVNVNAKSQIAFAGVDKITGGFAEKTGILRGSYSASGHVYVANSIVLQKQGQGFGYYLENGGSGNLSLHP